MPSPSPENSPAAHHESPPPASSPPPQSPSQRPHQPQSPKQPSSPSPASFFTFPVSHVMSGLYRRLTEPAPESAHNAPPRTSTEPMNARINASDDVVFTPRRTASPFQPPPLTPLSLRVSPAPSHQLLTRSLAEEIRLLVPPRLQLVDTWVLAYSLDRDGSSLSTLYEKSRECAARSQRAGYVLVVKNVSSTHSKGGDADDTGGDTVRGGSGGSLFGAYLTDAPHPASHYYGTGECFLWKASTVVSTPVLQVDPNGQIVPTGSPEGQDINLGDLPPPPSADTTNLQTRSTTFRGTA